MAERYGSACMASVLISAAIILVSPRDVATMQAATGRLARNAVCAGSVPGQTAAAGQMLALINAERAQAGAGPLHFDAPLNAVAQARSQDMSTRHYFAHQIPGLPGVHSVFDLLARAHVLYKLAGENIARNNYLDYYPLAQTVQQTNTDLMNSPDHRANILALQYTQLGLGMACEQGTGALILTEVFVQP